MTRVLGSMETRCWTPSPKRSRSGIRNESGQAVLLMVVLCATVLLGFAGLAVDVGTLFRAKRVVQTVADSAAIAGASRLLYTGVASAAQTDAALNGMTNGANGATVTVNNPPLSGPHTGNAGYVEVIATQSSPTFFMNVFGRSSVPVSGRAVAFLGAGKGCIVALAPSGTGLSVSGNGSVTAPKCGIAVDSVDPSAAMSVNGNISVTASSIGVAGGFSQKGSSGSVTPTPTTGVAAVSDPLGYLATPSCAGAGSTSGNTYSPGSFSSGISLKKDSTFNAGLYCLGGNLTMTGNPTVTGTGVTFYFYNSASVDLKGGGTLNLSAPTSGTYNGILFYQDRSDSTGVSFGGNAGGSLEGALYFPDASVSLGGTSNGTFYVAIVAQTVSLSGTPNLLDYATINGSPPIKAATLVE